MKVVTINIDKGGVGKSSLTYNLAKWLSDRQDKKVLLCDGDYSCNLSKSVEQNYERANIGDIFKGNPVEFYSASPNLDFLQGSEMLKNDVLDTKQPMVHLNFFRWIADNYDRLKEYDYLLIDTHNDDSIVTQNFLVASDIVLGVSDASDNGLRAWFELKTLIDQLKSTVMDPMSRESYVVAEPYLVMNGIDMRTNTGKSYVETASSDPRYLGTITYRDLMSRTLPESTSIFDFYEAMTPSGKKEVRSFVDDIENLFQKIVEKIDETE